MQINNEDVAMQTNASKMAANTKKELLMIHSMPADALKGWASVIYKSYHWNIYMSQDIHNDTR